MLIGLNPLLSPDLLYCLRAMGHADEIVLVDANYPGEAHTDRLIRCDGSTASQMLEAILSIMPLDTFVDDPAHTMQNAAAPDVLPPAVQDFQTIIDAKADAPRPIRQMERFAFYDRARSAFAIVQTGDLRHFANVILKKGVLADRQN